MKFLVIQTAFIGDAILATSVAEKLHHTYPEAEISFLVKKGHESLFEEHPFIRKVFVFDKSRKGRELVRLIREFRKIRFNYIINLHRFLSSGLVTVCSGAEKTCGFSKNQMSFLYTKRYPHEFQKGIHETDRNHSLISDFTSQSVARPRLYPSESCFEKVRQTETYICIAPASVWFTKQYTVEKWIEFVREHGKEYRICFLGGKEDLDLCERIIQESGHADCINFAGKLSFLESAALMKNAKINFVNDSSPLHLASAVDAAVTVIYCSTVPDFGFGPLSTKSIIIEADIQLNCRPCGLHGHKACPEKHFQCAEILPEMISIKSGI